MKRIILILALALALLVAVSPASSGTKKPTPNSVCANCNDGLTCGPSNYTQIVALNGHYYLCAYDVWYGYFWVTLS